MRQLNAYKLLQAVASSGTEAEELREIAKEQFRLYLSGARFGMFACIRQSSTDNLS